MWDGTPAQTLPGVSDLWPSGPRTASLFSFLGLLFRMHGSNVESLLMSRYFKICKYFITAAFDCTMQTPL
jgi:hypothetical protein